MWRKPKISQIEGELNKLWYTTEYATNKNKCGRTVCTNTEEI